MLAIANVETPEQRNSVVELARAIWFEHYPGIISFAQIHYMLERGYRPELIAQEQHHGIEWHLAVVDAAPVGFVSFGRSAQDLKVHKVYVLRRAQGLGVGRALMDIAHAVAREERYSGVVLTVNIGNLSSIRAYLALGYAFAGRVRMPIGHGFVMDDYVMRRALS
ncbi:MAG: GNAT family N-acetyltransferase [Gammaproteobacteria bacterium]|nr:GNAT family N-acetyltransferase [Gammaproteobacteria bacterium]